MIVWAVTTAPPCPRCGAAFPPDTSLGGLCPSCLLTAALSNDADEYESLEDSSTTIPPGTEIGPFRIMKLLGRGGMAAVYEAHDPRLERSIALKVLPPEFLHDGSFARRFEHEARLVARLEHPNIVPIYASGIDAGIPWMSMRLLAGGNLGDVLENRRLETREALRMLREVADALDYAHARGVVHRDIKPTNILLDGSEGVCIGDFGLARMLEGDRRVTRTGTLIGTPHYMAPEQALGEPVDHRCDIYSLGIVAYEMFVGATPFTADSPVAVLLKHVNQPLPIPPDNVLSKPLVDAIQKAVAKSPLERWSSAGAFVAGLEAALGVTLAQANAHQSGRAERPSIRARVGWVGAGAVGLSAAVGLTWWMAREPAPNVQSPALLASQQPSDTLPPVSLMPVPREQIVATPGPVSPASDPSLSRAMQAAPVLQPIGLPPTEAPLSSIASSLDAPSPQPSSAPPPAASIDSPTPTALTPGAATSQTVVSDVVKPPTRVRTFNPVYPAAARAAQLEGDVLLQAVVGPDGKVRDVKVLRSLHPLVDEAARKAVLRYEYLPAERNGSPEPATIRVTVSFRLR